MSGQRPGRRPVYDRYRVATVLAVRDRLRAGLAAEFLGRTPAGPDFARLVDLAAALLPRGVDRDALVDSLRPLAGRPLDQAAVDECAWRLAGNYRRLRRRRPVPPWHGQRLAEWVAVQVVRCRRERSPSGKPGARFWFRVLTGTPAGLTATRFWSARLCHVLALELGFDRPRNGRAARFPYVAPEQFVGLRLHALVRPEESDHAPGFRQVVTTPADRRWNRETVRCRFRAADGFRCLLGLSHDRLPCHHCPVGFTRCRAATHRHDWTRRYCPSCGRNDAFFDPEEPGERCVDCSRRQAYG